MGSHPENGAGLTASSPVRRRRITDAACLAALALGTWAIWSAMISRPTQRVAFEVFDMFAYLLPAYTYEGARLRELSLPLWNPYQGAGVPFLAVLQPGALYPARLLLLFTDPVTATAWSTLGHLGVLVLGMYGACRVMGATPAGAIVGAVAFAVACGRPMLFFPPFLEGSAWLPVIAIAAQRTIATGRWRWAATLGTSVAMPALAGGYQLVVYVAYLVPIVVVAILVDRRRRGGRDIWPVAGQLLVAGVLAIGLASPQLLPTLAWSKEAVRQTTELTALQMQPLGILKTWQTLLYEKLTQLTLPAAFLAAVGFVRAGRFGLVLGAFAVVGLMLSLGPGAPGSFLYWYVPGFGMFRGPGRIFTMAVAFVAALAASLGFSALLRTSILGRARRIAEGLAVGLFLVVAVPRMRAETVLPWTSQNSLFRDGMPGMFDELKDTGGRVWLLGRPADWAVTARQGMMHAFPVLNDYDSLSARNLRDYLGALAGVPIREDVLPFTGSILPTEPLRHPHLLDLAAVRSVVLPKDSPIRERTPRFVPIRDYVIYDLVANAGALPRAYLASHVRMAPDVAGALAAITDEGFDGHREAVVIGRPDDAETTVLRSAPAEPVREARVWLDSPERVAIDVATDRPALVVLADAWAPGWRVTVDGSSRPLRQVNHLMRGVVVAPGDKVAEFTYTAPGFAAGLWAAAVAGVAFGACAMVLRNR